ncbi:MAG: 3-deoxy-D-manno-octulosonic acid transferase [Devosia sp.]
MPATENRKVSIGWRLYGGLVTALSWLHYVVLSRFGRSDEGGSDWFRRRLNPALPPPATGRRIWIHAVSAGETKVAELFRQRLLAADPGLSIVLSSTTWSGYARIRAIAGDDASFIMPLDTLAAQRRVFATLRPDLLVLVESEFWPAQFESADEAGVPVVVVNATMSPRSFARHQRNGAIASRTLSRAHRIYAQDQPIADRYAALGVPRDHIAIGGNLKLVPPAIHTPISKSAPQMVVFGNVHRDELDQLAPAIANLRTARPELRVVLVPRYPEKIPGEVLSARFGTALRVIYDIVDLPDAGTLVWVDQMGVLSRLYQQATVGVVCGTFADIGGHDLAEPLHASAAGIYGPDVSRQKPLHEALTVLGSAVQVSTTAELPDAILALVDNAPRREAMIANFHTVSADAERQLTTIVEELLAMAATKD